MIKNQLKTVLLLGALTAILLWVGNIWGTNGLIIAAVVVLIMNVGSYFFSDKIVLKMYRAKEIKKENDEKLYYLVKDVAERANLPLPKLYKITSSNPNAFATGRNPQHSAIAVTTGIMELLTERELKGVIAHEMAHIKNRDILVSTIAATIAGIIGYVAMMARWGAIFGGFGRDNDSGNIFELLALMIVVPLTATLIQLAISRSREFMADSKGAKFLDDSNSLADALEKLESGSKRHPLKNNNQSAASLFIVNPFHAKNFLNWFSTHPPIQERVKKLRKMKF